ncbi:MAG TPA: ABC transporter ATP-binding protein [Pyrinomonadaceae bacterium]|nr:ABC transporter ATP-binding protein [Pyrinomonadaceae bacterium]
MRTKLQNLLTHNLTAEKWNFGLALFCTLVVAISDLLRPWPLKLIIDNILLGKPLPSSLHSFETFFAHEKIWATVAVAALLIVLSAIKGFSVYAQTSITSRIGYRIAHALRRELFSHLQRLSLAFHKRSKAGELLTKVTSDTNSVRDAFSEFALTLVTEVLTLAGMVVIMLAMNVELSLVVLATFPVLAVISVYRFRRIRDSARKVRKAEGNLASRVSETLHAIAIVKAFGRERYETERFESESSETLNESIRTARLEAASSRAADIVNAFGTFAVLVFGSLQAMRGQITPGSLLVFVSYMNSLYVPIRTLAKLSAKLSRAFVSAGRISDTLGVEPEVEDRPGAREATALRGNISFRQVSFGYNDAGPVLRNISFSITAGEKVALLGRSGAGKSTIVSLLLRLYEEQQGEILLDGVNIKDFQRESLRQQIGIVMQDIVMFGASIRENIAYGKLDATSEEIVRAAKAANAHEFISSLEDGYDTILGARGGTLSGGQRQRLALARAFVRNAPILILDEPMTGLDSESEEAVRDALERLMRGKTCLLITHDLASAAAADRVLILENGRIVEHGTPLELLETGERYRHLWNTHVTRNRPLTIPVQ